MVLVIHGIPTCDTCRKARKKLEEWNLPHQWVDLRSSPPTPEQLTSWVRTLGSGPLRNTSGRSYRALGPERSQWSDERWIQAFAEDPMLLKRPIVTRGDTPVLVGFRGTEEALRARLSDPASPAG